ncbi:PQQ-binding-like beta-propeller repeat protein [Adhaeretor mobilis]|uniref:Outer membrane biogenesis protein BamB n=1 Tax=Adhaeretor mobilis TaxID=1930276 RepID=A0A517MVY7_9BACT|nr:PQQ-binding-like beta-propeller repeat protein [Adhaeretor mobilis]QDS99036.1 outer membrane biogenesis protein BamB [Adhaeretor mobilis]
MSLSHLGKALVPCVVYLLVSAANLQAEDWPQWRGPSRDGLSRETGLLQEWPADGPPQVWVSKNCGIGYSGPAVVGDWIYLLGSREGTEKLLALDAKTGEERWFADIGDEYENDWGNGPRGTPTVHEGQVYAMGGQGTLICADAKTGKIAWRKSMQELGGKTPTWGYSESPLIHGDHVIVTPGGKQGAIVAINRTNGDLVWQSKELTSGAHYASVMATERNGKSELVQLLVDKGVGVDAATGQLLWKTPWPGRVAVIPTPIIKDDYVYFSSGYGVGSKLVSIDDQYNVEVVYDNKVMKNHHGSVVLVRDHLYGHSDKVGWVCQEFSSGKAAWREREALGKGSVTYADGRLYCITKDEGIAALVEPSPEGWKEHGRFTLAPLSELRKKKGRIWTQPVVSNGRMYLRDQDLLYSFDVSTQGADLVRN